MSGNTHTVAMRQIAYTAARQRLIDLAAELARVNDWTVSAGPFKGMRLPKAASWGSDGDLAPKLLGAYEAELHQAIETAIARKPEIVVNVGCAEGYYAIGLARRLPEAKVYAFDISEAAQQVCAAAGAENGVGDRLIVGGRCDGAKLVELARQGRALIVMDCEGGERELLGAEIVPELAGCDIIVECHDFLDRSLTPTLLPRLREAHQVQPIREGARDPSQYPALQRLSSFDRWLTVCEFRPEVMHWLVAWSRQAHA